MIVDVGDLLVLVAESSPLEKWHVSYNSDAIMFNSTGPTHFFADEDAEQKALADAELIVAMRQNIVSLCRELQSARKAIEYASAWIFAEKDYQDTLEDLERVKLAYRKLKELEGKE